MVLILENELNNKGVEVCSFIKLYFIVEYAFIIHGLYGC